MLLYTRPSWGIKKLTRCVLASLAVLLIAQEARATEPVIVNEFLPNPTTGEDWVEIYNPTGETAALANWQLRDETASSIYQFPLDAALLANEFLAVDVGNRLNKDRDTISLYADTGELVDSYAYRTNPGENVTIGRFPDGSNWTSLQNPTKGMSNSAGLPLPTPTAIPTPTIAPTPTPKPPTPTPTSKPTASPMLTPTPKPPTATPAPTIPTTITVSSVTGTAARQSNDTVDRNIEEPEVSLEIVKVASPSTERKEAPVVLGTKNTASRFPKILTILGGFLTVGFGLPLIIHEVRLRGSKKSRTRDE